MFREKRDRQIFIMFYVFVSFVLILYVVVHKKYHSSTPNIIHKSSIATKKVTLGDFTITAYCPGSCCNQQWAGLLANGNTMEYYLKKGINICAVDPQIIPLGSFIYFRNVVYLAADTGTKIKGKRIDLLLTTHDKSIEFGVQQSVSIDVEMVQ